MGRCSSKAQRDGCEFFYVLSRLAICHWVIQKCYPPFDARIIVVEGFLGLRVDDLALTNFHEPAFACCLCLWHLERTLEYWPTEHMVRTQGTQSTEYSFQTPSAYLHMIGMAYQVEVVNTAVKYTDRLIRDIYVIQIGYIAGRVKGDIGGKL